MNPIDFYRHLFVVLRVLRDASNLLVWLLVYGPALGLVVLLCASYLQDGKNPVTENVRATVEWAEKFRSVPQGEVPAQKCSIPSALDEIRPTLKDCSQTSQTVDVWVTETVQTLRDIYLISVLITGLAMFLFRFLRIGFTVVADARLDPHQRGASPEL